MHSGACKHRRVREFGCALAGHAQQQAAGASFVALHACALQAAPLGRCLPYSAYACARALPPLYPPQSLKRAHIHRRSSRHARLTAAPAAWERPCAPSAPPAMYPSTRRPCFTCPAAPGCVCSHPHPHPSVCHPCSSPAGCCRATCDAGMDADLGRPRAAEWGAGEGAGLPLYEVGPLSCTRRALVGVLPSCWGRTQGQVAERHAGGHRRGPHAQRAPGGAKPQARVLKGTASCARCAAFEHICICASARVRTWWQQGGACPCFGPAYMQAAPLPRLTRTHAPMSPHPYIPTTMRNPLFPPPAAPTPHARTLTRWALSDRDAASAAPPPRDMRGEEAAAALGVPAMGVLLGRPACGDGSTEGALRREGAW